MKVQSRLGVGLSVAAALWCLALAVYLDNLPLMRGGRTPFFLEALLMVWWPLAASAVAMWAAAIGRPGGVALMAALVGAYSVVTGFSIGRGFLPALALLLWAALASVSAARVRRPALPDRTSEQSEF
jgi:hypothetical protein